MCLVKMALQSQWGAHCWVFYLHQFLETILLGRDSLGYWNTLTFILVPSAILTQGTMTWVKIAIWYKTWAHCLSFFQPQFLVTTLLSQGHLGWFKDSLSSFCCQVFFFIFAHIDLRQKNDCSESLRRLLLVFLSPQFLGFCDWVKPCRVTLRILHLSWCFLVSFGIVSLGRGLLGC